VTSTQRLGEKKGRDKRRMFRKGETFEIGLEREKGKLPKLGSSQVGWRKDCQGRLGGWGVQRKQKRPKKGSSALCVWILFTEFENTRSGHDGACL
jgi:hypothetical protein